MAVSRNPVLPNSSTNRDHDRRNRFRRRHRCLDRGQVDPRSRSGVAASRQDWKPKAGPGRTVALYCVARSSHDRDRQTSQVASEPRARHRSEDAVFPHESHVVKQR